MSRAVITSVTEGVWCIQRPDFLSCSYLVLRGEEVILVDSGIDPDGEDVREGLDAVGRSAADVRAILLTHWHNDHSSGAAVIAAESGARVYYHEAADERMTRRTRARGLRGAIGAKIPGAGFWAPFKGLFELAPTQAVAATAFVADGEVVEDDFLVIETPGHSEGHLSYLYRPERVLFVGDALAVAGDHVSFMSRFLTQDIEAARASMIRCLEVDAAAICPGHRHPLIAPDRRHREEMIRSVSTLNWWPIVGC